MSDVPLLLPQVTVHRGMFWFRDNESVCYSISPETAHEIVFHWPLLPNSMREGQLTFTVGPYRVTKRLTASVELPLRTYYQGTRGVMVSIEWIARIQPLLEYAYRIHQQDPNDSFTIVFGEEGRATRVEPDRQSIPPQKE